MTLTLVRTLLVLSLTVEAVAIVTSLLLLVDTRKDLDAVRASLIRNGRRIVARTTMATETLRLGSLIGFTVATAAATAALWNPTFPIPTPLIVALWALLVSFVTMLAQSVSVYAMRRRLFDTYRHDRPDPPAGSDAPAG